MAAWLDKYVPGSFRGAAFKMLRHNHRFGRRGEDTEFPFRDVPWGDDLGRLGRGWRIEVFVIGDDYMAGRDALLAACEAKGPGTLVHPYLGAFQAQARECELTESTEEGGMARFLLAFTEPGTAVTSDAAPDTQGAASAAADTTDGDAETGFDDGFALDGFPSFLVDQAVAQVEGIVAAIVTAATSLGGSGPALRTFQAGLVTLGGAAPLLRAPASFAAVAVGLVGTLTSLGTRPLDQVAALRQVMAAAAIVPAVPAAVASVPARMQQAANGQAIADLFVLAAAGASVRAVAAASFSSYDEAVSVRDALGDDLDDQVLAAADRGNDALADDLDILRRAMIVDVTARGGSLERLVTITPIIVQPALVLAWNQYRDTDSVVDQADDIVARNAIPHPGFVHAEPLQVLTSSTDG